MKIGLSTLFLSGKPYEKCFSVMEKYGQVCKGWEIVDEDKMKLDEKIVRRLKELAASYGFEYCVHAPFCDLNIASLNPALLDISLKAVEKSAAKAALLEAKMFIFHPGFRGALDSFYPNLAWEVNLKSVERISKLAESLSLPHAIENMPQNIPAVLARVEDFQEFFSSMESSSLGFALDIGHSNIVGQTELFIRRFQKRISHVHLHDNRGDRDAHLELGAGTTSWLPTVKKFQAFGFNGYFMVESIFNPYGSFLKLKEASKP
ncbi:sugar phosphate isomerase/epimerase [Candidatus Hecatella orcuttiae]|uniref:sugar phosphate isomerase/epimerase family protein n=1 Tax=Candidatus Hecatella orcuttiae TaxID=1935119 RepID=UPI0028682623|nr:sugar phosphate isomerase/epimerase [Candidatus Hecatella orcuttiae]